MPAPRKKSDTNIGKTLPVVEGKLPPQAPELEEAVLGALLLEKDAYAQIDEILRPETFYVRANGLIYKAIQDLSMEQKPVDMLTVKNRLQSEGVLEEVGGPQYISGLTLRVSSTANIVYHANLIQQKYIARCLIHFSNEVSIKAYEEKEAVEDLMQYAESTLFNITQNNAKQDFTQINPIIASAMHDIQNAANRQEGISGVTSGFPGIDKMTSGWQNSDLIIIAARPAMGKTAFVLSMAKNMAIDHKIPIALFNMEMSAIQLVKRLMSNVCEIPGEKLKSGRLEEHEWEQLHGKISKLYDAPFYIDDTPSLSIFELRTKARRLVREYRVEMIIIDYLQLMNANGMGGNREQEVSLISRSLKVLAKELKIPVVALSQLNRGVENRQAKDDVASSKRPQLSDLRESGAIEQDADIVCFIHRPEYYKILADKDGNDLRGVAEFIIAKHRNGPVGDVRLRFQAMFAKFASMEEVGPIGKGSLLSSSTISSTPDMGGGEIYSTEQDLINMGNKFGNDPF